MKNNQLWDRPKIRKQIDRTLDLIEARDMQADSDMAGGGCSAMVSILFALERIADETFFGTIELNRKGPRTVKPTVSRQTFKMDVLYDGYII